MSSRNGGREALEAEFQKRRIRPFVREVLRRNGVTDLDSLRRLTMDDIQGMRLSAYDQQKVKQLLGNIPVRSGNPFVEL